MLLRLLMSGMIILTGGLAVANAQVLSDRNILMPEVTKEWKTLETQHFRFHHVAEHKEYAQNLATIAERVHGRLTDWLGWQPQDKTEVVILDTVDLSNGNATPLPYNRISIYLPTPVDGELMDQTPWLEMVFTHEYVHILHLDMAFGAPQVMRNIFGRSTDLFTLFDFPQIFAPTWVAEGLAVYGESRFSGQSEHAGQDGKAKSHGRLNSSFYEAMMRMEVQRGLRSLTEVSFNSGYRWPYGQAYLYGAYFFKFVEAQYGRDAVTRYIRVYGSNFIPFRMQNRSDQIFGKPANIVWAEFQQYLTQRFTPQLATIKQQNRFSMHTVYDAPYNNAALAASSVGDLYFLHDDTSSSPQIRRIRADGSNEFVIDGRGVQEIAWHDDSGLLLSKFAVCDNTNVYADLYQWKPGMSSSRRLTQCGRYIFAAWRPDGMAIAAIQSDKGLSRLMLLNASGGTLGVLAVLPMGDTLGHIAWSPDGASLVATIQRKKTGWNLELLNIKTHLWQTLTSTDDLVQRPQFSKDGSEIYFLSDHASVWNLRRLKLGGEKIETISNTTSAITEVVVMPDKSYRMVEYTGKGKSIIALEAAAIQTEQPYAAINTDLPAVDAINNAPDFQPYEYTEVKNYSPWRTLRPHSFFPLLVSSTDQISFVGGLISGADALNFHRWNAAPLYYYEQKVLGGLANYSFYNKVTVSAERQFFIVGAIDAVDRQRNDEVRYQTLLHHTFNTFDSSLYLAAGVASEEIKTLVIQGAAVNQTYQNRIAGAIAQYDNSRFYKRSIAPVDGRRVQLLSENYDQLGGSDYSGKTTRIDWNEFIALGNNHALHFRVLYAQSDAGIRPYRLGGVSETLSKIGGETGLGRRDFPLRGYPSGLAALTGSNLGLATVEWEIPLGYHYNGWFVPPVGVGRESLTLFVDSGDAWNRGETTKTKTGVGAELNFEALLGYDLLRLPITLGVARGVNQGGESRLYLRVALPFF